MSIAFRDSANANSNTANVSVLVNKPPTLALGDLLLFCIWSDNNSAGIAAPTWPSGFTGILHADKSGAGDAYLSVAWKIATGSEGADYTATLAANDAGGWSAAIVAYSGTSISGPIDVTGTFAVGSQTTTPCSVGTAITTTRNNAMLVSIVGPWPLGFFTASRVGSWSLSGFTSREQVESTDYTALFIADAIQASAGASGTQTSALAFTTSASQCALGGALISLTPEFGSGLLMSDFRNRLVL